MGRYHSTPEFEEDAEAAFDEIDEVGRAVKDSPTSDGGTDYQVYPAEDATKDELGDALELYNTGSSFWWTISPTDGHDFLWVGVRPRE